MYPITPALSLALALAAVFLTSESAHALCPNRNELGNYLPAPNVSSSFGNSSNLSTYSFTSLVNENSAGGAPGLIEYCVYPDPPSEPNDITPAAAGDDGAAWNSISCSDHFSFSRPNGTASNIGFDGNMHGMGSATWSNRPATQTILLHIQDTEVCKNLYGECLETCFVFAK